ncbi:flavin reductase [Rhodococcus sp. 5G237]
MNFDPGEYRRVLGHYPTGVVVVTACDGDGEPVGMVIGSFTSVSLDPPLVAFLPTKTSYRFARLREAKSFCVNILGHEQEEVCRRIASTPEGLGDVPWHLGSGGAPVLDEAVAWFDCTYESILEAGDHYIVLGRVQEFGAHNPRSPLIFFQGGMGRFASSSMVLSEDAGLIEGVRLGNAARNEMEILATEFDAECSAMVPVGDDLVLVAIANNATSSDGSLLGTRVPLIAPMGEAYIAFGGDDDIEGWLARAGTLDESTVADYRTRLRTIRERGWSMSLAGPAEERVLYTDFRRRAEGSLTPVQERALAAKVSGLARFYRPVEESNDEQFEVHSIVAPVLDDGGRPVMVLRLAHFPEALDGPTAHRIGQRLVAGARRIEPSLPVTA